MFSIDSCVFKISVAFWVTESTASQFPAAQRSQVGSEEDVSKAGSSHAAQWRVALAQCDFTALACACARSALEVEFSDVQNLQLCEAWPSL